MKDIIEVDSKINRKSLFFQALWNNLTQQVDILILRNYENFPSDLGNDIDLLIRKNSINTVEQIINDTCEKWNFSIIKKRKRYGFLTFDIRDNSNINEVIKIDFFTTLSKGWMDYAYPEDILSNKVQFKEYFVPLLAHEAYLIFMKEFCMYGHLRDKYYHKFSQKYKNVDTNEFYKLSQGLILSSDIDKIVNEYSHINELSIIPKPTLLNLLKLRNFLKWIYLDIKFKIFRKGNIDG